MARRIRCKTCNTLHQPNEECWQCKYDKVDAETIARINSRPHKFIDSPDLRPSGRKVKYAYKGVPGIWVVDEFGNHWCGTDSIVPC